jgi:hypothetical protein
MRTIGGTTENLGGICFGIGSALFRPDRFFAKIVDMLLAKTRNNGARVGSAMTYVVSTRELLEFAMPLMKAVAADPLAADSLREGGIRS